MNIIIVNGHFASSYNSIMSHFLTSVQSSMLILSKHVAQYTSIQVFLIRVSVLLFLKVSKLLGFKSVHELASVVENHDTEKLPVLG